MPSDHFSSQSAAYARYRPSYPAELFEWIAAQVHERSLAWDCACGNGQATLGIADHFERVVGTDLSADQLSHAPARSNIEWRVAEAEESGLESSSVDLITVAQALHWFDLVRFWPECRRVLKPRGVVAVWCYGVFELDPGPVAEICDDYYRNQLDAYWPPERALVAAGYGGIDFPFAEIAAPDFQLCATWTLEELLGYFSSWSATERYRKSTGVDPIPDLRQRLSPWFSTETIAVRWPLSIRIGRRF